MIIVKAMVLINPSSGKEEGCDYRAPIKEKLLESFDEVEIAVIEDSEELQQAMRRAFEEEMDAVFSVGGDGTVIKLLKSLQKEILT